MQNPGLAIYENNNWLQICPPNLSYLYFTDLELDNNNNAWIAAPNNGLYKYNGNTFTEYNTSNSTLPYNNVSKLKFDNSGNLWIASGKFLIKFNGSTFALVDSVNFGTFWWSLSNNINDIDIAPAGNIYLATGVGLCIYKPSDGTWINYKTSNSSIPSNDINLVKVNAMGDVWITCTGTNNNFYITRFRGGNWVGVSKTTCPMDALPTDMQLDNYGNLWFVSSNANRGGLYKLADTTYIYSSVPTIYQNTTFAVFPNPNNGYFTIQSDKESAFELMDITGRIINTYRVYGRLDVSENLPEGMYFVRDIENGVSQKIVIK
jgi:ligand-binding sensor domain-containing protein